MGRDFPGIRVGPEPTTDRFTALLWGPNDKIVPGAALCSQSDLPFNGLSPYGNNFLSRLEGVEADSPILRNVTLIDTPGILSGQKQRSRNGSEGAMFKVAPTQLLSNAGCFYAITAEAAEWQGGHAEASGSSLRCHQKQECGERRKNP